MRYSFLLCVLVCAGIANAELAVEPIPNVKKLPAEYPDSYVFAHDANFYSLIAGKVIIVDIEADTHEYKGAIGAAQFGTFIESNARSELYVGETFFSRGTTGDRTDFVSIYDKQSLDRVAEVALPGGKRGQFVTNKYTFQLVDKDRYLLVYNFTPASSVHVVDTNSRTLLNEIQVPGCSMIYPTGERGFTALCGNGAATSIQFDESGEQTHRESIEPFFNPDEDPVFDKPAYLGDMAYFVSYKSSVYPVDMSSDTAQPGEPWSFVDDKLQTEDWRPSGWQILSSDNKRYLYVIMQSGGFDGSHKSGGEEIWVLDTKAKKLKRRIKPETPAFSLEFVPGSSQKLAVTNVNMGLDIYTPEGTLIRSLTLGDAAMPVILHSRR